MSNAIEITELEVTFPSGAGVRDVSLQVAYGEVVTLLGPNGAGKTTTVETLLGFRSPTSGSVRVHGLNPVRDHREVVARTGALLQRGGVWSPMTPRQVLTLTSSYYQAPRDWHELLELLQLEGCQRTPWRREAERLSDRLVILTKGRVAAAGSLDELAGRAELVVDLSGPLDASFLADALHCAVTNDGPSRLRCATESTPEVVGLVNEALARHGVSIVALRTRASLEERYLDIVSDDQGTAEP